MFGWTLNRENRKMRFNLEDGPTIEGVLMGKTRDDYIVWAPRIVQGEGVGPVELSGHVEIPRTRVVWKQSVA